MLENWLLRYADVIRLTCFILAVVGLSYWQWRRPWRQTRQLKQRWWHHLGLKAVSILTAKALFAMTLVYAAWVVEQDKAGLLAQSGLPWSIKCIIGWLFLDFTVYWQHRWMHKWSWLWRLHQVHHLDKTIDVSTGIRFHPLEDLFSMAVKMMAVVFMGAPMLAVLVFEITLNMAALFTHANVDIPIQSEHWLRRFFVTPQMHAIHHSIEPAEQRRNYGFCLSCWDRIFSTYLPDTRMLWHKMLFGLESYRQQDVDNLKTLLLHPFKKSPKKTRKIKAKMQAWENV